MKFFEFISFYFFYRIEKFISLQLKIDWLSFISSYLIVMVQNYLKYIFFVGLNIKLNFVDLQTIN